MGDWRGMPGMMGGSMAADAQPVGMERAITLRLRRQ